LIPVIEQLRTNQDFRVKTLFTGQHARDVLGAELLFGEGPFDLELNVLRPGQSLAELNARLLIAVSVEIEKLNPDICIVHGDTTTALASAMAAFYLGVPIAHVEAGLRTRNLEAPFPEEFNRQTIARIATWNFAPTEASRDNLINEAIERSSIYVTGNTVVDTLQLVVNRLRTDSQLSQEIHNSVSRISPALHDASSLILVTAHRRENHAVGIREICLGIAEFAQQDLNCTILFAMHPNPVVQRIVMEVLSGVSNVILTGPLGYGEFVYLLSRCLAVVTDSGGIQEEAVSLGKTVLVTRDSTERAEGVASGLLRVVGANSKRITHALGEVLRDNSPSEGTQGSFALSPYGDGKSSDRIVAVLAGDSMEEFVAPDTETGQGNL
jgi:UDP-N-acetylglucosamine 2-epimerase (non-hydrolysing)